MTFTGSPTQLMGITSKRELMSRGTLGRWATTLTTTSNGPEDEEETEPACRFITSRCDWWHGGAVWNNKIVTATSQYYSPLFRHQRGGIWGICTRVADANWDWIPESVPHWWPCVWGRGSTEDEQPREHRDRYHPESYSICLELQIRRKGADGRGPDSGSLAIIHRQANQGSKSGTMELSKSRAGIKAALTGHCNPIEMFTLHLSKVNGCGEEEVRRKGCPVAFDVKLWKVRRLGWGKRRKKNLCDRLGLLKLELHNVPWLFWLWICGEQFFFTPFFFFPAFLWTFQWQHYDDIWDAIAWPLCMWSRIKAGYFLKRPPSHPLVPSLLARHFISPSFLYLNPLITWGDAALMLTPSKKKKKKKAGSSLYLSALKILPIFPAHFTQSRNSGHSISHTGAFYLIEHNMPGTSMNIDSLKLCIMEVLRF